MPMALLFNAYLLFVHNLVIILSMKGLWFSTWSLIHKMQLYGHLLIKNICGIAAALIIKSNKTKTITQIRK